MKKLKNMKIAILLCDGFEEVEMTKPRAALQRAGAQVDLISPNKQNVKAWHHDHWTKKYKITHTLQKARAKNYIALVLPGGVMNPDKLRTIKPAVEFIKHFFQKNKLIAAICHGPWSLIETKMIAGKKMTSYHSIKTDLINASVKWENKAVVINDKLITSRDPHDIPAFNKAIIQVLTKGDK